MRRFGGDDRIEHLRTGWSLALTPPDACPTPAEAATLADWIAAEVPGTAAGALERAGRPTEGLHGQDIWWRRPLEGVGPRLLRFEGLATEVEVWLDGAQIAATSSMYEALEVEVELSSDHVLWLACRALVPILARKAPRARWRPKMIPNQGLRTVRTTLLGQTPGWTPPYDAVGPYREVSCITRADPALEVLDLRASLVGEAGVIEISVRLDPAPATPPVLVCAGRRLRLETRGEGVHGGRISLPGVEPWWPHTHGAPALYDLKLETKTAAYDLGRTGFRRVELDRDADGRGFGLRINDTPIFCRGAVWTSAGVRDLPGDVEAYRPWLERARDAGMNMIRMSGTGVYETAAFHDLCDELGLLVWQDLMLANFDYPVADEVFREMLDREARGVLMARQASPSLVVLSGGSEIHQQAAMLGLKPQALANPVLDEDVPALVAELRPDLIYTPNSPFGGPQPFVVDEGVSHYYGVGAYGRGLDDLRRANLRFAAECLAFANVPQASSLKGVVDGPADPAWKAGVPRDLGASWDFEDVRDVYLRLLYGHDPARLRREDPALYLDLSRMVSAELMGEALSEWRREASSCRGALVWTLQDVRPGAGWGLLDAGAEPKPAWYGFRRAAQPLQAALTDEGLNGLSIHLRNETPVARSVRLEMSLWRGGRQRIARAEREVTLGARSSQALSLLEMLGTFLDVTYAYRFGPPGHELTVAVLTDAATGEVLSEAFHYPLGRSALQQGDGVEVALAPEAGGWRLSLTAEAFVAGVHLEMAGFETDDDWFHLTPGRTKVVRLRLRPGTAPDARPEGLVLAPGGARLARISA
ncbi:glycoside hydrolase family 2 protein [Phenylobacterium aquaticum]|uniref:glycoside hydrolase family 2 protein n=2 Tax=Phenylobacterium aquaticum TaxID=1763816 RepID=UPI0026EBBBC2|nr:glycoside hydrolase family 2 protein [Phenylobacterium aquaticum]